MILTALALAATLGATEAGKSGPVEKALGDLAYTVGACQQVSPDRSADAMVLALTGADRDNPSDEQKAYRSVFSTLFAQGQATRNPEALSRAACDQMIETLTTALHEAVDEAFPL